MSLQDEINEKSQGIYRESYQMSIGELINLYREKEIDIHPEFQRLYRWSDYQKTKLIESIMLNIPIPPIFVSQDEEGVWDIIDGVQRLSTIFQFYGILRDEDENLQEPLVLQSTESLPSFAGMTWNGKEEGLRFTKEQQLAFKRSRLDVTIIKKESDENTKYELFQRLNTGGSLLSNQEVRNCLIIMTNNNFYKFIIELDKIESFKDTIPISDRKSDEQYRIELIIRLLVAINMDLSKCGDYQELSELLDKEILKICKIKNYQFEEINRKFTTTFNLLYGVLNENVFKKYFDNKFKGPFLSSAYQTIAIGTFTNIDEIIKLPDYGKWLEDKIKEIYNDETYIKYTTPGARAIPRFKELSELGMRYFRP